MSIMYVKYVIRHLILWEHPHNKTTINSDKSNTPGETANIFVPVNYSLTKWWVGARAYIVFAQQ